jgi:hypothetical protein
MHVGLSWRRGSVERSRVGRAAGDLEFTEWWETEITELPGKHPPRGRRDRDLACPWGPWGR